jgi:hypothetical protein
MEGVLLFSQNGASFAFSRLTEQLCCTVDELFGQGETVYAQTCVFRLLKHVLLGSMHGRKYLGNMFPCMSLKKDIIVHCCQQCCLAIVGCRQL